MVWTGHVFNALEAVLSVQLGLIARFKWREAAFWERAHEQSVWPVLPCATILYVLVPWRYGLLWLSSAATVHGCQWMSAVVSAWRYGFVCHLAIMFHRQAPSPLVLASIDDEAGHMSHVGLLLSRASQVVAGCCVL